MAWTDAARQASAAARRAKSKGTQTGSNRRMVGGTVQKKGGKWVVTNKVYVEKPSVTKGWGKSPGPVKSKFSEPGGGIKGNPRKPSKAKVAAARKKARETGYIGTPKRISREFADKYSTAAQIRRKYYR